MPQRVLEAGCSLEVWQTDQWVIVIANGILTPLREDWLR